MVRGEGLTRQPAFSPKSSAKETSERVQNQCRRSRGLSSQNIKVVFVHDMKAGRFEGPARGRPGEFIQKDHLTKKIARPKLGHWLGNLRGGIATKNFHTSLGHDKKGPAQMPFLKNHIPRRVCFFHHPVDQARQIPPTQIFEKDNVAKKMDFLPVDRIS